MSTRARRPSRACAYCRPVASTGQWGYTLVELLVVLALMSVLASMTLPLTKMVQQRQKERELKSALLQIRSALDAYRDARAKGLILSGPGTASLYPPDLDTLTRLHPNAGDSSRPLRFLRSIPRDPFSPAGVPAAQSWGLRSYLSEPDKPEPGADVYDVHSHSAGRALDGTLLSTW